MPERDHSSHLFKLLVEAGVFFCGGVLGLAMAMATAPGSVIAYFLGFSMLPIVYVTIRDVWLTLRGINSARRWVLRLFSARARRQHAQQKPSTDRFPGFLFTATAYVGVTALAGWLTAIFVKIPAGETAFRYAVLGLVYGAIFWWLAHAGYLQAEDSF